MFALNLAHACQLSVCLNNSLIFLYTLDVFFIKNSSQIGSMKSFFKIFNIIVYLYLKFKLEINN